MLRYNFFILKKLASGVELMLMNQFNLWLELMLEYNQEKQKKKTNSTGSLTSTTSVVIAPLFFEVDYKQLIGSSFESFG